MRFSYSINIVYNNFPWPEPTEQQKALIEHTAQEILEARAKYPGRSLAELYDTATMPDDLRRAHHYNDHAVAKAYGFPPDMPEPEIVAELFKRYQQIVAKRN